MEVTIEQMNEAIARFMGGVKQTIPQGGLHGYKEGTVLWMYLFSDNADPVRTFEYHESWDWLMPVGKKIYDLLAEMAKQRPPHTACHGDMIEVDITCHIREYNITGAHKSIYEFVQWFNSQKQTP